MATMIRQILSRAFPSLERDLSRTVGKELRAMDECSACMKPEVYSFQPIGTAGYVPAAGGAFARSGPMQSPVKVVRVSRTVESRGLFHD